LILIHIQTFLNLGVMLLGKLIEAFLHDEERMLYYHIIGMFFSLQLNDKTFLKTSRRDTGGIEVLNLTEYLLHFIDVRLDILAKGKIVDDCFQITTDISVIFDTSDKLLTDHLLTLIQF